MIHTTTKKLIWMIFSLGTDANRDAIFFPSCSKVKSKGCSEFNWLVNQSAPSTLSTVLVHTKFVYSADCLTCSEQDIVCIFILKLWAPSFVIFIGKASLAGVALNFLCLTSLQQIFAPDEAEEIELRLFHSWSQSPGLSNATYSFWDKMLLIKVKFNHNTFWAGTNILFFFLHDKKQNDCKSGI